MIRRTSWLAAWLLFANPLAAMDAHGNYAVWGKGKTACISYTRDRSKGEEDSYRSFLMGFLTATDLLMDDTYDIAGGRTLEEILDWLDEYCATDPMSSFEAAISKFTAEHFDTRLRRPGGGW